MLFKLIIFPFPGLNQRLGKINISFNTIFGMKKKIVSDIGLSSLMPSVKRKRNVKLILYLLLQVTVTVDAVVYYRVSNPTMVR